MSCLIIIDDKCPDNADPVGSLGPSEQTCVLSFHYEQDAIEAWADRVFKQTSHRPTLIHGGARFHAAAPWVKKEYSKLVAQIPKRYVRFGKTLNELLAFEGRLSLWWLLEVSMKNSEPHTYPVHRQQQIRENFGTNFVAQAFTL